MPWNRKSMSDLKRPDIQTAKDLDRIPVVIILENIRSGLNIGSVFRTADALLARKILLTGFSVCPPHREILKTALDATLSVPWSYHTETRTALAELKSEGYQLVAVEQVHGSIDLPSFDVKGHLPLALVFGNEVDGVSDETLASCDAVIEIPQSGIKHSLNISVCAGIVLWHCYQAVYF